jgi:DNA-binding NarL/FixJ family response regulator
MTAQKKVLVVEDEFLIAAALGVQIEAMGHVFCGSAPSAYRGIVMAREMQPDIILMDMRLEGDVDGVDAALAINQIASPKIIFITGSKAPETLDRIALAHPAAILFKPYSNNELGRAINAADLH